MKRKRKPKMKKKKRRKNDELLESSQRPLCEGHKCHAIKLPNMLAVHHGLAWKQYSIVLFAGISFQLGKQTPINQALFRNNLKIFKPSWLGRHANNFFDDLKKMRSIQKKKTKKNVVYLSSIIARRKLLKMRCTLPYHYLCAALRLRKA